MTKIVDKKLIFSSIELEDCVQEDSLSRILGHRQSTRYNVVQRNGEIFEALDSFREDAPPRTHTPYFFPVTKIRNDISTSMYSIGRNDYLDRGFEKQIKKHVKRIINLIDAGMVVTSAVGNFNVKKILEYIEELINEKKLETNKHKKKKSNRSSRLKDSSIKHQLKFLYTLKMKVIQVFLPYRFSIIQENRTEDEEHKEMMRRVNSILLQ